MTARSMLVDVTPRLYQETILNTCTLANTLVVLPTGLGKTLIAMMLSAQRLAQYPGSKILILAPTKPLVLQHHQTFSLHFIPDAGGHAILTGEISPEKRAKAWKDSTFLYATPQSLENDLLSNRLKLDEVSLLVVDEGHHAVGDYAYVYIAKRYHETSQHPRILALTASPGAKPEHILEVCKNLHVTEIEARSADDGDVAPYLQEVDIKTIQVELTPELLEIKKNLDECFERKIKEAQSLGLLAPGRHTKTELLGAQAELHAKIAQGERDFASLRSISLLAEALKVSHAQEMLETQGLAGLSSYFSRMDAEALRSTTKAVQNLVRDATWRMASVKTRRLLAQGHQHPKLPACTTLIKERLGHTHEDKAIVFTQFRDTGKEIVAELNKTPGIHAELFVGQQKKGDTGSSRKEAAAILARFREGRFNTLVATSVAEEGLDIPSVNVVVFFEPIPSAIRTIQRRGRTGRNDRGEIYTLVTKGTRDEIHRWSAHHKEKRMYRTLTDIKKLLRSAPSTERGKQQTLTTDAPGSSGGRETILIRVDPREKGSPVMKELVGSGVQLDLARLEAGDYQLSPRVICEYKTQEDFIDSIIDGRLLNQARAMKQHAIRSIFIVEGERDLQGIRNIHPNAINGMLTTIAISFNTPVLFTKNPKETAAMLISIAKKEAPYGLSRWRGQQLKKPTTPREQQEHLLASMPGVSAGLSKKLLEHFGSPARALSASVDDLKGVPLVGEKKAEQIYQLLHEPYPGKEDGKMERPKDIGAESTADRPEN